MNVPFPPWLGQSANPAELYLQGLSAGTRIGAERAAQQMRQQQLAADEHQFAVQMAQRFAEASLTRQQRQQEMDQARMQFEQTLALDKLKEARAAAMSEREAKLGEAGLALRKEEFGLKKDEAAEDEAARLAYEKLIASGKSPADAMLAIPRITKEGTGLGTLAAMEEYRKAKPRKYYVKDAQGNTQTIVENARSGTITQMRSASQNRDYTYNTRLLSLQRQWIKYADILQQDRFGLAAETKLEELGGPDKVSKLKPLLKQAYDLRQRNIKAQQDIGREMDKMRSEYEAATKTEAQMPPPNDAEFLGDDSIVYDIPKDPSLLDPNKTYSSPVYGLVKWNPQTRKFYPAPQ